MKTIRFILLLSASFLAFSCINDLGNYDYLTKEEVIPITLSGFNDTTAIVGSTLEITPQIDNMDDENRYVYLWYAAKSVTAGNLPTRDTLSQKRNLSIPVKMEANTYNLVFEVRNPLKDVYVRKQVTLTVRANEINKGWYILKEMDGKTDFDYVTDDGSKTIPDVLKNIAGKEAYYNGPVAIGDLQLQGKPIKIIYQSSGYYQSVEDANGKVTTLSNQQVFHILSEGDIKTFNAKNIYLFKNFNDEFYEAPKVEPQNMLLQSRDLYLINNGKLHAYAGIAANVGKFTYSQTSTLSPNYKLHSGTLSSSYGAIVFDTVTRSFFQAASSGSTLNKIAEPKIDSGLPSVTSMDYDLFQFIERAQVIATRTAYCLLKHTQTGKYYLAFVSTNGSTNYPFTSFREVPDNAQMPTADVFAFPRYASCVYFAKGNKLWYYLDAPDIEDHETLIKTFPADEKVAFIDHLLADTLVVLTNSPSGWHLYRFPVIGTTPDINPESAVVLSGSGERRYVMYRMY